MRAFFDSSSFAKRYVTEKGSSQVDDMCMQASALGLCILCLPEIISAFNRKVREKSLSSYDYALAKDRLFEDIRDAEIIQLVPQVITRTTSLLEVSTLRAMDALHVACAIEWDAEIFISSDKNQIQAARKAKLNCKYI